MDILDKLVHMPTSDKYILSKINTNVVIYSDLKKYKRINDLFINDSFIILYENTAGQIGHWVCVIRRGHLLSYFDSYGKLPDPPEYLKGEYPYLSQLLYSSPYNLEYNEYDYQRAGVSTCGHHVIVRILFKYRPLEEYQHFLSQFKNDDEVVTAISHMIR
jgi:hypothetical protein